MVYQRGPVGGSSDHPLGLVAGLVVIPREVIISNVGANLNASRLGRGVLGVVRITVIGRVLDVIT